MENKTTAEVPVRDAPGETRPPSPNGSIGRDAGGRFAAGNRGGPGNPFAGKVGELRRALYDAVSTEDLTAVIEGLVEKAKAGHVPAARELLERLFGKPVEIDLIERIEMLEEVLEARSHA